MRHDDTGAVAIAIILGVSAVGASLLAQVEPSHGGDIATWIQGGGAATAVGVLGYIARLMATGRLVARDPAEQAAIMRDVIEKQADLIEKFADLTDQAHKREDAWHRIVLRLTPTKGAD